MGKPVVVFAQRLAVVGSKDHEAVVVDLIRFEPIEQAPEFVVEVADLFVVAIFVKARCALGIDNLVVGDLAKAFLAGSESRHDAWAWFALEGSFERGGRGIGAMRVLVMNPEEIAVLLGALIFEPCDGGVRRRVSRALEVAFAEPTALVHFIVVNARIPGRCRLRCRLHSVAEVPNLKRSPRSKWRCLEAFRARFELRRA